MKDPLGFVRLICGIGIAAALGATGAFIGTLSAHAEEQCDNLPDTVAYVNNTIADAHDAVLEALDVLPDIEKPKRVLIPVKKTVRFLHALTNIIDSEEGEVAGVYEYFPNVTRENAKQLKRLTARLTPKRITQRRLMRVLLNLEYALREFGEKNHDAFEEDCPHLYSLSLRSGAASVVTDEIMALFGVSAPLDPIMENILTMFVIAYPNVTTQAEIVEILFGGNNAGAEPTETEEMPDYDDVEL